MPTSVRKLALTSHVSLSIALLGAIASFLVLAIAGLTAGTADTLRETYPAMAVTTRFVIVPLALAALLGGTIQALGTRWGLFRHKWVVAKLLLTGFAVAVLLVKLPMIAFAARHALDGAGPDPAFSRAQIQLVAHAGAGLLVLLVPVILSIYKPWGMTRYGVRTVSR
jgi:hypothetical protein